MRVPFGSSNTSARSCAQNSPSKPPSGVTLTLCAEAESDSADRSAAIAAKQVVRSFIEVSLIDLVVHATPRACGARRSVLRDAGVLHQLGPEQVVLREEGGELLARCRQRHLGAVT